MRAKFSCSSVQESFSDKYEDGKPVLDAEQKPVKVKYSESVSFMAVYSPDPTSENYAWSQATPSGSLSMTITNPGAFGHFKQGAEYYLDFFEVPKSS
jgi:hypothetical protein